MRAANALPSLLLLTAFVGGSVFAQSPAQPTAGQNEVPSRQETPAEDRNNQRIERITVEDGGSRIDEVRVGGQTKSISVQPKAGTDMPQYEVQPINGVRNGGPSSSGAADTNTAPRVWTLRKF